MEIEDTRKNSNFAAPDLLCSAVLARKLIDHVIAVRVQAQHGNFTSDYNQARYLKA
jgi:hypothetical protein